MNNRHNRLIILDRDGVINQNAPDGVAAPEQWRALPGSLDAIAHLCRADYRVVVITNQSGIARGRYSINTLNQIHRKMLDELQSRGGEISAIFFCPHADEDDCDCRKPKPGLFLELAERLQRDLNDVYAVGDSLRDLQAARAAGARPVLVETGHGRDTVRAIAAGDAGPELAAFAEFAEVPAHKDLAAFVDDLLAGDG